jgi:hypothetical protein
MRTSASGSSRTPGPPAGRPASTREQQAEAAVRQAEARVELSRHQITVLNEQLRQTALR